MELREDILQELKEQKQKAIYKQEEWLANELWCLIEVYNIHKNYLAMFQRKRLIFRYDRKIPDYFSVAGAP